MARTKRKIASFTFSLRKTYQKVLALKPPLFLVALLTAALSIFLLGGGVYDLLTQPVGVMPGGAQGRWIFYVPFRINEQSLNESIFVMLLYAIGFGGFFSIYQSTRYAYKPRQAFMWLLIGVLLVALAYFGCEYLLISLKLGR